MPRTVTDLYREAAQLSEADRAALAGLLLGSLEPQPSGDVKAAWAREIERRSREVDAGTAELIDWDVVRRELFADE